MGILLKMSSWFNLLVFRTNNTHLMCVSFERHSKVLNKPPCAWYHDLYQFVISMGFVNSRIDTTLFIYDKSSLTAHLFVYVDDLIFMRNNDDFLTDVIFQLANKFSIKDLDNLYFFLGFEIVLTPSGLFLSQTMCIWNLLEMAKIQDAKFVYSPMSTS